MHSVRTTVVLRSHTGVTLEVSYDSRWYTKCEAVRAAVSYLHGYRRGGQLFFAVRPHHQPHQSSCETVQDDAEPRETERPS